MKAKHVSMLRAAIDPERGRADHFETGETDRAEVVFQHTRSTGKVIEVYTPNEPIKRVHELLHAKHTKPKEKWPDVSEDTRQVIEDIKMHRLFWPWGYGDLSKTPQVVHDSIERVSLGEFDILKRNIKTLKGKKEDKFSRANRLMCLARTMSLPNGDSLVAKKAYPAQIISIPEWEVLQRVVSLCSSAKTWRKGAVLFETLVNGEPEGDPGGKGKGKKGKGKKGGDGMEAGETVVEDMTIIDLPKPCACLPFVKEDDELASCGRTINYRELLRGKMFMRPNRLFTRIKEEDMRGGSVLIDASGSMNLTQQRLEALCKQLPAATIAYYGGNDAYRGDLVIYAKNGKRAEKSREVLHGNAIDRPALKWLLDQEEPRYFITDEKFCGAGEWSVLAIAQLQAAKASGAVLRIPTISAAEEYFSIPVNPS